MRYVPLPSMLGFFFLLALAGCAPTMTVAPPSLTVAPPTLTSGAAMAGGKRIPASSFTLQDRVVMLVDITWPDPTQDRGAHETAWKWFRGNTLVSETPARMSDFRSTPWTLTDARAAATLGAGAFSVETFVDGNVVATSRFTITR